MYSAVPTREVVCAPCTEVVGDEVVKGSWSMEERAEGGDDEKGNEMEGGVSRTL
jgi:hypothetical protein